jgi:DNA-binding winged helix-turn-helix (wHTH) protein/Tol biopolymer transport system component
VAPKPSPELLRFGTFEVDFRAGELRKQGRKIRLQDLPFQLLTVLLEHPGQVVTRDELVRRLWSEYAAIDVENGLNTAAKKLRLALGDDAETPRFIETLPRRGYRFIGAVEALQAAKPLDAQAVLPAAAAPVLEIPDAVLAPAAPERPAHFPYRRWVIALAAVIVLGLPTFRLLMPARSPSMLRTVQLTHTGRVEQFDSILTDGSRIYFNERTGGQWSLAQVSVEGGTPSPIQTPPGIPELLAISPNRSELLVKISARENRDDAPLWIVPTVSGSPRRLGNVMGHAGAWSRDGSGIVYGFDRALYRMNSDGTDIRKLANTPTPPFYISWSPGPPDLLRFTLIGPLFSIWECSPDGSGMRAFAPSAPWAKTARGVFGAGWTSDGKYYVFESRDEHGTSFWVVPEAGRLFGPFDRQPIQIYSTPTDMGALVPGLDGKRFFFAAGQGSRDLVSYDAKRNQFLPFLSGDAVRSVSFSQDGQWASYATVPECTLWRSRADGSDRLQLTSPPLCVYEPQWSPDGRRIAFGGQQMGRSEEESRVYVVPSNGGSMEAVPMEPYRSSNPSWSPDGQSLMMNCWRPGARAETMAICVLDWRTRQGTVLPGSENLLRPRWSPDGQYVAALRDSGAQVVLFDMRSHQWTALADGANYGVPFWTRDGRYFYFQEVLGDTEQPIFRVNAATRAVERTMSSRQLPQSGFSGYLLTGLTPGDAPIANVLRENGDLYELDVVLP